jgi:hypothetical protein
MAIIPSTRVSGPTRFLSKLLSLVNGRGIQAADQPQTMPGASDEQISEMLRLLCLPSKGHLIPAQCVFVGPDEGWVGRLTWRMHMGKDETRSFFQDGMADLGWHLFGVIEGPVSVLNLVRGERAVSIQVESSWGANSVAVILFMPFKSS